MKLQINDIIVLCDGQTDSSLIIIEYHKEYKMKLKRKQNYRSKERRCKQRVSQIIQNEAEGETELIIFYLYLIKF